MQSKLMNKYFKNSPNKPEPITEGWGMFLAHTAVFLGLGAVLAAPTIATLGAAAACTALIVGANAHLNSKAEQAVNKILGEPKVKKYIISECDKIFKKLSNEYNGKKSMWRIKKGVSENLLNSEFPDDVGDKKVKSSMKHIILTKRIGEYAVGLFADTDHIQAMHVFFTLTRKGDSGEEVLKLVQHVIPSPSKEDIKAMGFREE